MPLFELKDLQPIRLQINIPETDAVLIDIAEITFPELANSNLSAIFTRNVYSVDETKTMRVEVDLPNKDFKIRHGMYAKVDIKRSGHQNALSVPNEAIGNKGTIIYLCSAEWKGKKGRCKDRYS